MTTANLKTYRYRGELYLGSPPIDLVAGDEPVRTCNDRTWPCSVEDLRGQFRVREACATGDWPSDQLVSSDRRAALKLMRSLEPDDGVTRSDSELEAAFEGGDLLAPLPPEPARATRARLVARGLVEPGPFDGIETVEGLREVIEEQSRIIEEYKLAIEEMKSSGLEAYGSHGSLEPHTCDGVDSKLIGAPNADGKPSGEGDA